jgi:hypothetical protein
VLQQPVDWLALRQGEDAAKVGELSPGLVSVVGVGDPPMRRDGTDGARDPLAAGEAGQLCAPAGQHHGRRLAHPDGFPHREHTATNR